MVYRPGLLPDAAATMARWRERLAAAGVGEPLLVMAQSFGSTDPRPFGMDVAAEFPPHNGDVPQRKPVFLFDADYRGRIAEYEDVVSLFVGLPPVDYPVFRCVMPSWDNEARRPSRGFTFRDATPAAYEGWLTEVLPPHGSRARAGASYRLRQRVERVGRGRLPRAGPPLRARVPAGDRTGAARRAIGRRGARLGRAVRAGVRPAGTLGTG
jgi:hypothetical protein